MKILGISSYYHDSAVALIEDGKIVFAAQEERFSRIKNDESFPVKSIQSCLKNQGISINDLDAIVFYEKPFLKFERILDSYIKTAPSSLKSFLAAMPVWLKSKLFLKNNIRKEIKTLYPEFDQKKIKIYFSEHHLSHAASAFYPSNFDEALIIVMDGVGEYATTSIFKGKGKEITPLYEQHFPDSIGLLYSSITQFLGFEINNGEYKIMGLAPYMDTSDELTKEYTRRIKDKLLRINEDGSIELNGAYFKYAKSLKMIDTSRFEKLFEIKQRKTSDDLTMKHAAIAQALQCVTEEIVFKIIAFGLKKYPSNHLCLAGGVALNCVLNGKIQESGLFQSIFIQPSSGDAGGSVGAGLALYHLHFGKDRLSKSENPCNQFLGPSFDSGAIEKLLKQKNINYQKRTDTELIEQLANALVDGKIVGHFRERMEFGPRALGNRSILANPLLEDVQLQLNLKIKKRESFRPFAPLVLMEDFQTYFGKMYESPFMLMVHKLKDGHRKNTTETVDIFQKVQQVRSPFPGVTHVDYSSRIQTVTEESNAFLFELLQKFKAKTNVGMLINTSFNVKDEPIVCSPEDAINCFYSTEIDILVLNNYWIEKWNS